MLRLVRGVCRGAWLWLIARRRPRREAVEVEQARAVWPEVAAALEGMRARSEALVLREVGGIAGVHVAVVREDWRAGSAVVFWVARDPDHCGPPDQTRPVPALSTITNEDAGPKSSATMGGRPAGSACIARRVEYRSATATVEHSSGEQT